jgi:hypothetical protein
VDKLVLRGNQIHEAGVRALKQVLITNNTLSHLDLSWNPLERNGCMDVTELVEVGGARGRAEGRAACDDA